VPAPVLKNFPVGGGDPRDYTAPVYPNPCSFRELEHTNASIVGVKNLTVVSRHRLRCTLRGYSIIAFRCKEGDRSSSRALLAEFLEEVTA
jgi:hypothetical protein